MIEKTKEVEASYTKSLNEKLDTQLESFNVKSIEDELKKLKETLRGPNLLIE